MLNISFIGALSVLHIPVGDGGLCSKQIKRSNLVQGFIFGLWIGLSVSERNSGLLNFYLLNNCHLCLSVNFQPLFIGHN